ncbi:MAG: HAD hydrolase family protein [Tannerella sp.]|jgi:3-deoxy-D-manno-octulosonate 8-phosphate phosphatase (KDO 8-P phosphatase)|nr:HAD hydrolase family protein [Tannerella sp.]
MSSINYDLRKIKGFLFDVDGVLSTDCIPLAENGDPMRMVNIKDGYALQLAVKQGYHLGIITGGYTESVKIRFKRLGIPHIYMRSSTKIADYEDFLLKTGLKDEEIVYAGDDIPDYEVMLRVGLPVAPATAAPEIKAIAKHISPLRGGEGIAREIIEQTMKAQERWMKGDAFGW